MPTREGIVSIIIPIYNAADWLSRCLDSVIGQSYGGLEIILINDGSSDGSLASCRKYADRDSRFVIVDQANAGPSVARNVGLDCASGEFIMFVDADDYIEADMVAALVEAVRRGQCGWSICGCNQWGWVGGEARAEIIRLGIDGVRPAVESLLGFTWGEVKIMTLFASLWNKLYLASVIHDQGIRFGKTCPGTEISVYPQEDFFFNMHYLQHTELAAFVDRPLYNYQTHQTNENAVRKYRPHAFELHQEVYAAVRERLWPICSPEQKKRFNRHYLDKTLIVIGMLCRDNTVFDQQKLRRKIADIVSDAEVVRSLECYSPEGSQDNTRVEMLRQQDVTGLYEWGRRWGNKVYGLG